MTTLTEANFIEIIRSAFLNPNEEIRRKSEAVISSSMHSFPDQFGLLCVHFFNDDQLELALRRTISVVLRLAIKPSRENENSSIWTIISGETQTRIQECSLIKLVDEQEEIKKIAASMVADVFACDCLHARKWTGLLPTLTANLSHDDPAIQKSAILTLGYICEILHRDKILNLTDEQVDSLITGICLGLKSFNENTITALKALENSVNFLVESLKKEVVSDFIMNLLVSTLMKGIEHQHKEIVHQSILSLTEVSRIIYNQFQKYHELVFSNIIKSISFMTKPILFAANEFFLALTTIELIDSDIRFLDSFCMNAVEKIFESLIALIPNEFETIDPEDEVDLLRSSVQTISCFNKLYFDQTIRPLSCLIQVYLLKDDFASKIAAFVAFESLLEVPVRYDVRELIDKYFFQLCIEIMKPDLRLKNQVSYVFQKMAQFYYKSFMEPKHFNTFFQIFLNDFESSEYNCTKFSLYCKIWDNLFYKFKYMCPLSQTNLNLKCERFLTLYYDTIQNTQATLHYINEVYSITGLLITEVLSKLDYSKWFMILFTRLSILQARFDPSEQIHQIHLEGIFTNLSQILRGVIRQNQNLILPSDTSTSIIFSSVLIFFSRIGDICGDGLVFLVTLIELDTEIMESQMDYFIRSFLGKAIEFSNRPKLFRECIMSLTSLTHIYKSKMDQYIEQFLPYILNFIQNPKMQRNINIDLFLCITDMLAFNPKVSFPQLPQILVILEMAFGAVIHLQMNPQKEEEFYVDSLKEILVDTMLVILQGTYFGKENVAHRPLVDQFLPKVIEFIRMRTCPMFDPGIDYLKDSLVLLLDIFLANREAKLVDKNLVLSIYTPLSDHRHDFDINQVIEEVDDLFLNSQNFLQMNTAV